MHRHLAVTAVVSLLVVACNGENRPIPAVGPPRTLPPNNGTEALKGALPGKIGEISAAQFKAVIRDLEPWDGGNDADRCTDTFLCGLGFSKVPVSIKPAFDAVNANFVNVGTNGTVLLRLKNDGDKKTGGLGRYELEPHKTYYVVVKSDGDKKARWDLIPFEDTQTDPPKTAEKGGGSFHSCEHKPYDKSEAAFYTCEGSEKAHKGTASSTKQSALGDFGMIGALMHFAAFAPSFLRQSPGWVSCAFGCCTLEGS
jgi:hypothetical protein